MLAALASPSVTAACRVVFGARGAEVLRMTSPALHVALPVLAGTEDECLVSAAEPPQKRGNFTVFRTPGGLTGFALAAPNLDLEAATADLYRQLFGVTPGLHLHRIWNYVPRINEVVDGLENYRRFCRGRSLAFEKHFGREFQDRLPAASGVGAMRGPLAISFVAGKQAPRHFENPRQVPAPNYPLEYGPRPPSFARATLVQSAPGRRKLFISGTAAIRGHATVAAGDLSAQLDCTVENLRLISETAGVGADLGAAAGWQRTFKIYLRHDADLARAQAHLGRFLRRDDDVSYLHADLCRADLLVEIEAVLMK